MSRVICIVVLLGLFGCATSRPILYPNEHYQAVGSVTADRDIADCGRRAESAGARPQTADAAHVGGGTAVGAGVGAAGGAAAGAISGSAGIGAAAGAVGGAVAGLIGSLFSREPKRDAAYRNYVDRCLQEKGYETTGWS
jgi:outer membrane lipoprotein SlyB